MLSLRRIWISDFNPKIPDSSQAQTDKTKLLCQCTQITSNSKTDEVTQR